MSKQEGDEIEMASFTVDGGVPFRRWRNGQVVQAGVGYPRKTPGRGDTCLEHGPEKENGRHDVKQTYVITAEGSVCHSGVSTPEYRDGWDRIFAERKKPNSAKAN